MSLTIASPLAGWVTPLAQVPDPVFADRLLGDGVAIDPAEGRLVAPGPGQVVSVHPAGHAVTLALDSGPVLLMHIGLDTVALGGAGFAPKVRDRERVTAGQLLVEFDLDRLARTARSLITPVIVTNGEAFAIQPPGADHGIAAGERLLVFNRLGRRLEQEIGGEAHLESRTLRLPLAHGLHARPAARIATLARQSDGRLEIATADGRTASARSAVAMLALGLSHGAPVTVRGSDTAAVDAMTALLESGLGEHRPVSDTGTPASPTPALPPLAPGERLSGVTAVPGAAIGAAFWLADPLAALPTGAGAPEVERTALDTALASVRRALDGEAEGEGQATQIAAAHRVLLDDPELIDEARARMAAGAPAGRAWIDAVDGAMAQLRASPDPRLRERVDDLADLARRVALASAGIDASPAPPPPGAILLAEDLYPSQALALSDAQLGGVVTAHGGPTSHVAIIMAGLGVPMLVAAGERLKSVPEGATVLLEQGGLRYDPEPAGIAGARARLDHARGRRVTAAAHAQEPAITRDGRRIEVFANLGSAADAHAAVAAGAEGCGLLRTEFLFLDRSQPPTVDEQRAAYGEIAAALDGRPLIVRTLDIGADKPAPYLPMPGEENPALGQRGIRLQLAEPGLLDAQLRALVRMDAPVRIMLPMVSELAELRAVRTALARIAEEERRIAPELGIMIETPAAALIAGTLAREADFFSIGSNDLAQYTLARDRTNPRVAASLDALHPAVLRLIAATVEGADRHGRWTGICGGLGADPGAVPLLLGLGITELSVPPASIAETKARVRELDLEHCRTLAARALEAADAQAVRALVQEQGETVA